jgi:hypothetical protein
MIACQPKDNKLSTPNRSGTPGPQSTGGSPHLKVGSYGLPILATQSIEKMGSLVLFCLQTIQNGEIDAIHNDNKVQFDCVITQDLEQLQGRNTQIINDEWHLRVEFNQETQSYDLAQVVSISAKRNKGYVISKFKENVLKTTFNSDRFTVSRVNERLDFKMTQNFEISSNQNISFFTFQSLGSILVNTDVWTVNFDSLYRHINQSKGFTVQSKAMEIQWKSNSCANFKGEASVQDGSVFATVQLQSELARLVTDKRPWQQSLVPCSGRDFSFQNFDFIFY